MGMSIQVITDNYKDLPSKELYQLHLSRNFAELMARINASFGEPELKQVERIAKVNLSPLWKMATYHDENVDVPENNIMTVYATVVDLMDKLSVIQDLQTLIVPYDNDINLNSYFSDFPTERDNNPSGNNFKQDIKNLKMILDYVLSKGATKLWFNIE